MATIILSGEYFNQDLLAQSAANTILGDGLSDFSLSFNYFGFNSSTNSSADADGWTPTLASDKKTLKYVRKSSSNEDGDYAKDDSVTFTGTGLNDLENSYRVSQFQYSIKHNRSYDTNPKTNKPIPEKYEDSGTLKGLINESGLTFTELNSSLTDVSTNPDETLSFQEETYIYPVTYKETRLFKGEHFQNWDSTFTAKDIRSFSKKTEYSHQFDNSAGATKTNIYKVDNSISSKEGLELLAENLVFDENNSPTSWENISFNGVVDSLNLSQSGTWTDDSTSPQFTGIASYKSTEKNPYIADALNKVLSDSANGGDDLESALT
jgi:hypothetical protein